MGGGPNLKRSFFKCRSKGFYILYFFWAEISLKYLTFGFGLGSSLVAAKELYADDGGRIFSMA